MNKTEVLVKRIERANAEKSGYSLGNGYNSSWKSALNTLATQGKVTLNKSSRGKARGYWVSKSPATPVLKPVENSK